MPDIVQMLHLISGDTINKRVAQWKPDPALNDEQQLNRIYLSSLARRPSAEEESESRLPWRLETSARCFRTWCGRFSIRTSSCTTIRQGDAMTQFDRRGFLKIGAILPWGYLSWGDALAAEAKKDISVIHLFLQGGISQMDSFDPKPDCDPKFRSVFKTIPTNVAGMQVTEHLPFTAKQADKYRDHPVDDAQEIGAWRSGNAAADRP